MAQRGAAITTKKVLKMLHGGCISKAAFNLNALKLQN